MFSVRRFDCFPLSKGDDTFWFGSKTVGMCGDGMSVFCLKSEMKKGNLSRGEVIEGAWVVERFSLDRIVEECTGFCSSMDNVESTQGASPICEGSWSLSSIERQKEEKVGSVGMCIDDFEKSEIENSEGREDVREVFQQRGSGAKRKLSRCGRNQMGNEPILALPEGADDFVVYYDARSKDLEACLEKGEGDCLYVATTKGSYEGLYG
ncbi:hypothetical protein Tco_1102991 [Tanacetum coccineum]